MNSFIQLIKEQKEASWILSNGKFRYFDHNKTHIDDVTQNPARFKITSQYLASIYKKHNEPVGTEGRARDEIMLALFRKGFIRIRRYYIRMDSRYYIDAWTLDKQTKNKIYNWAEKTLRDKRNDDVRIITHGANKTVNTTIRDIVENESLFNEQKVWC